MVAEQFMSVRSNLQYVLSKINKPVILVTSSFSGEGKSFVSTNMAAVMALTGKKTIILEFDIRKPKILSGLGLGRRPGITNFMVGKAELNDLVIPVPGQDNLFVLPCGPIPPNPAELLLDQKVAELFDWARREFEYRRTIDWRRVGFCGDIWFCITASNKRAPHASEYSGSIADLHGHADFIWRSGASHKIFSWPHAVVDVPSANLYADCVICEYSARAAIQRSISFC